MKELIKVEQKEIGADIVSAVSARELHSFLEIKKQFSDWFRDNSKLFIINQDFTPLRVNAYHESVLDEIVAHMI